ncbi:MAG: AraC family transcriptional regulator, partial [Gammaproteobacteria bacterium]|nr:AraC family transcriptional regulator [Gammaproteobacteria bacterium]
MNSDYQRISLVISYLNDNARRQPGLEELAEVCGLSPYHFQRLFRRWAGISPKQFLQYITVQHARLLLESSAPILDTCFEVGLSGPGRLHDHF